METDYNDMMTKEEQDKAWENLRDELRIDYRKKYENEFADTTPTRRDRYAEYDRLNTLHIDNPPPRFVDNGWIYAPYVPLLTTPVVLRYGEPTYISRVKRTLPENYDVNWIKEGF